MMRVALKADGDVFRNTSRSRSEKRLRRKLGTACHYVPAMLGPDCPEGSAKKRMGKSGLRAQRTPIRVA